MSPRATQLKIPLAQAFWDVPTAAPTLFLSLPSGAVPALKEPRGCDKTLSPCHHGKLKASLRFHVPRFDKCWPGKTPGSAGLAQECAGTGAPGGSGSGTQPPTAGGPRGGQELCGVKLFLEGPSGAGKPLRAKNPMALLRPHSGLTGNAIMVLLGPPQWPYKDLTRTLLRPQKCLTEDPTRALLGTPKLP